VQRIFILNSLFFLGVVLNYPGFFIYNPFAAGFTILGLLQSISTAGWILTVCLPLINWMIRLMGAGMGGLIISILVWPISLLIIRGFLAMVYGDAGFQYLVSSPVFFVTDYIAPALLIWWVVHEGRLASRTAA
jgi:hypothetical protein